MKLYSVEGRDKPLMLSDEHAQLIGAVELRKTSTPARNASVQSWRDFAVELGAPELDVEQMTRTQLIEAYGDI